MRRFLVFFLFAACALRLASQCQTNSYHTLDINQVEVGFNNASEHFWDWIANTTYFVPKADRTSPTFASGLWVGGLSPQGQLHLSAATYRQAGAEYYAGPCRNPTAFACEGEVDLLAPMFRNGLQRLSNGKILLMDSLEVQIYDPQTAQVLVRPLPQIRPWLNAIELSDGRLMFFGDHLYPNKNPVLYMDTVNYNFTTGPNLIWFHKESTANELLNGKVLLAGVVSCEVFDPSTNTSVAVPDMLYPRAKHAAMRLPNGDVHAFGGGASINGTGLTLRTQYFDDSLGYWFPGPDMAVGRNSPSVVELSNGHFLIVGGTTLSGLCEIFDPIGDSIYPGPILPNARNLQNAVLVANDKVLVAQRDNAPMTGMISLMDLNTAQVTPIRIQDVGPQLLWVDSANVAAGYKGSQSIQLIDWKSGLQPKAKWQNLWKVNRTEIDQFQADFLANAVDFSQYPTIETWPAEGTVSDGEDRNLAPFIDVNMDGFYRPADDGDYPCIVGDQAIWWVFNDQGVHNESGGLPLDIQIEAMAYAFDCNQTTCPDTSLDYATFLHYEISNHSDSAWSNMYLGMHIDVDLGNFSDDFLGSDSTLNLGFVYNGDDNDGNYGAAPPSWGCSVLPNGQIDKMNSMISIDNSFGNFNSNPQTPEGFYNYLQGRWLDGQHVVNNGGNGHPGSATGPATGYMFPSTEGFCGGFLSGWSELTSGATPYDRKYIEGSGPFSLQPGQSISLDVYFPYARDSSHTKSVCALKNATAIVQDWWQNQLDRTCFSLVVGEEPKQAKAGMKVIPNPVTGTQFIADFGQPLDVRGELDIIDLNGKVVIHRAVDIGADNQLIDASSLPGGLYLVRLMQGEAQRVQRVVVW